MDLILLAAGQTPKFVYLLPLIAVVSLVYAATRHEDMNLILRHAGRVAAWTVGFMFLIWLALVCVSSWT